MAMQIGDRIKVNMNSKHRVGDQLLQVGGWFLVVAVEQGDFSDCKLYTLEKVRESVPEDYHKHAADTWDGKPFRSPMDWF
jgi:hypothetical protein